jgi:hypothetical protein
MIKRIFIFTIILTLSLWNLSAKDKSVIKEVTATYVSATVYTGYTGYFFKDKKTGKEIQVQDAHDPEMVKVPNNLLEDSKDLEGLPGANPKLVGKTYIIKYLNGDKIVVTKANRE